jgi:hypothetical protein
MRNEEKAGGAVPHSAFGEGKRVDRVPLVLRERMTIAIYRGEPPAPGEAREPDGRIVVEDGVEVERSGIALEEAHHGT